MTWQRFFDAAGLSTQGPVTVQQPSYFKALAELHQQPCLQVVLGIEAQRARGVAQVGVRVDAGRVQVAVSVVRPAAHGDRPG